MEETFAGTEGESLMVDAREKAVLLEVARERRWNPINAGVLGCWKEEVEEAFADY
jgi:hypothetical protein